LVSLIAALIKFNKYEDKIEDITRASEKCIITIAKLKEVKEELYFCKTVESFIKINDRFTRDIYTEYLDSNTNIERQLLDTDYAKYMKKVANNDVKRAEILVNRNKELDNIGRNSRWFLETYISKLLRKKSNPYTYTPSTRPPISSAVSYPIYEEEANLSETPRKFVPHKKTCSLTAEHNKKERPIPYRGGSPPPTRQFNYETRHQNMKSKNSLVKERLCIKCNKIYVIDINIMRTGCPYCDLHNQVISQIDIHGNSTSYAKAAIDIQKRWRDHITRKGRRSD
jgi:hypothetical protein